MKKINLLTEDIYKLFWKIALPSSIGTIFQNLYALVDAVYAGRMISEIALAAIGQTFPIYFIIIALGIGLSIATTSTIANYIGSKNYEKASKIFFQSIGLVLLVAILVSFLGIFFGSSILESINSDQQTLVLSNKYMNIIYLGSIFILLLMVSNSCLVALGDTKSYRNVLIFSFLLNVALNPILISGKILDIELFTPLNITGIALATILSQFIGLIYLLYKISKTVILKDFNKNFLIPNYLLIKEVLFQGIPASIGLLMIALGTYIIFYFVGNFGNNAIAGFSSAGRYEQLLFLPLLGLSTAVTSIVGQNFGAKNPKRILEAFKKAISTGLIILFIVAIILFFTAELSMKLFTDDKEVIYYGSVYLKIWAFGFPAFPLFFIPNATFQGLKKASIVMNMAILRFVLIPIIIVSLINYFIKEDYIYMFVGLVIMHWTVGLFYVKYSINKIKKLIN